MSEQPRPSWGCTHHTDQYVICVDCLREAAQEEERRLMREVLERLTAALELLLHPTVVYNAPADPPA